MYVRVLTHPSVCQNTDMTQGVGELDLSVGYALKQAAAALRTAMDAALRPLGLSVPQYACLELLGQRPGLSAADLARAAFVTRQSMHALLLGLQERGLLARATTATRGRALPTELTDAGRQVLAQASETVAEIERRMTAALPHTAQQRLRNDLAACTAALDDTAHRVTSPHSGERRSPPPGRVVLSGSHGSGDRPADVAGSGDAQLCGHARAGAVPVSFPLAEARVLPFGGEPHGDHPDSWGRCEGCRPAVRGSIAPSKSHQTTMRSSPAWTDRPAGPSSWPIARRGRSARTNASGSRCGRSSPSQRDKVRTRSEVSQVGRIGQE